MMSDNTSPITRSIPAWAGETREPSRPYPYHAVYPRVGGGNAAAGVVEVVADGLSPRGRGKRADDLAAVRDHRSIPAWAGETAREAKFDKM